ncbi:hypothetical protein PHLGIDRAFT_127001 [Phlebiopsis gigantea 11061_1 CR5-6]|uniref:Uncharacterized protein n=1 Tax=Phlebiopsis gigantea (strain 11061_1 CR5-6) TaxID=745531 RepID=A0A0C3S9P7_PHLG1|nr:hypothetical protein PHLGIDRAFT_127001 [Phlebiopsis gigantea 11061_1 CR5-6]
MPLFGHKNKTRHDSEGANSADITDNSQRDFATGRNDGHSNPTNTNKFHDANHYGVGGTSQGTSDAAFGGPAAGVGGGAGTGAGTETHHGHVHGHYGAGGGAGAMVGSAALREQAMMRDREAQNFQAQSKELAEAERLEQQAREHRERAVAQGAHPMNKNLGGGNLAGSGQNAGVAQNQGGTY